ncbi:lasso peptide biosynthesis B2 protein [Lentzea sp. DG1S-22]|uniref:lasso peptide biosynthesis B2 protein n=1 Tax=Lentzea sp. DG1S-22 TaxID=3108822 RepID=UPI002E7749E8|nr:lasso peptide biosynthesis B2 protein [Lentzea sp. DG1S-22]WVH77664.1 lasso peptide biosynthesis B2 protein [Lentzea sp. DG1S-22]
MKAKATALTRPAAGTIRGVPASAAVLVARVLGTRSPQRIRRVLTAVSKGARPATYEEAAAAHRAVLASSVMVAGDGCLPRSIAVALLCRLRGRWPTWHVGAQIHPFRAHAWVEAEGRAVGETGDMSRWKSLITVGPRGGSR